MSIETTSIETMSDETMSEQTTSEEATLEDATLEETSEEPMSVEATSIEIERLSNIIEAALLAFGQPLSIDRLMSLFSEDEQVSRQNVREALQLLQQSCEGHGIELVEVGSGFRYQARKDYAKWVSKLWEEKPPRYSRALLETLVLVAYRQPITRAEIEDIRGVSVSSHIMKTLQERDWVRVVGHKDVPGKPALYATTKAFLDYFNLKSLDELPSLMEIRDLDKISAEIDRQDQEIASEQAQTGSEAQQLLDSEDEERLFADGDADHGDGMEDSVDTIVATSVAVSSEPSIEEEIFETEASATDAPETESTEETLVENTMVVAEASAEPETMRAPQQEVATAEPLSDEQTQDSHLQDNHVILDESATEFDQADSNDTFESESSVQSVGIEDHTLETEQAARVEFPSDQEIDTADTMESQEEAGEPLSAIIDDDSEQSANAIEDKEDIEALEASHRDYDDTASIEGDSAPLQDVESEYAETTQMPSEDEPESAQESRFSTANYGLRAHEQGEHEEQDREEADYAEEEHDHHSDRLSATESNT